MATSPLGSRVVNGAGAQSADEVAERLVAFLRAAGAAAHPHAGGRALLDHLIGTYEIVRRWSQPQWLQHAALIHSVYGTDVHRNRLLPPSRRPELIELAGPRAERIAYLFSVTPRRPLFAGTYRWTSKLGGPVDATSLERQPAGRDELDAVVLLHMANLAEQTAARDGSPGLWLFKLRELAELLIDSEAVALPLFVAGLAQLSAADEREACRAYREGLAAADRSGEAESRLGLAAAVCPAVAEPCVWQAHNARCRGDLETAREWAACARQRLTALGTPWDRRLTYEEWLGLTRVLEQPDNDAGGPARRAIDDPRELFEALVGARPDPGAAGSSRLPSRPDAGTGRLRFLRYMDALADGDGFALKGVYPDLRSRPWHDPSAFPLAHYLEANFAEVRDELLSLDGSRFRPESERIPREGTWDVVFLYERGRRNDDVCAACPVTTRGIEGDGPMRTAAGLIYVSRMRARTHIAAHRGPTNLRLRCHLGLNVPEGDCAIRVGGETRRWTEGRCLVFDDHFEHEAWNHTDDDRLVLIVDLWQPALSNAEIALLSGLHGYASAYGRQLNRYWAANAAAGARSADG